jgi:hypothetical protein
MTSSDHHRRAFLNLAGSGAVAATTLGGWPAQGLAAELASPNVRRFEPKTQPLAGKLIRRVSGEELRRLPASHERIVELKARGLLEPRGPERYGRPPERRLLQRPVEDRLRTIPNLEREGALLDLEGRHIVKYDNVHHVKQTPKAQLAWPAFASDDDDTSADTGLAVSSSHVVVTSHFLAGFYDRNGTAEGSTVYIGDIFGSSTLSSLGVNYVFDGRSIYDHFRKRFWISILAYNNADKTTPNSLVLTAVSVSENPTDGWWLYYWPAGYDNTYTCDYPAMGIHEKCFIQTNHAAAPGASWSNYVHVVDADAMVSGGWNGGHRWWGLTNPDTGNEPTFIQPAVHHGSSSEVYFSGRDGDQLVNFAVSKPLQAGQSMGVLPRWSLTKASAPTAAPQPPSPAENRKLWMQNLADWVFKAVYRDGQLYAVMSDGVNWFGDSEYMSSVRLVRGGLPNNGHGVPAGINLDRVFGCNNSIEDPPTARMYYGFPAVEVTGAGDMVVVYSRSGKTLKPEARFSVYYNNDKDILPSRVLKAGDGVYVLDYKNPPWNTLPWADLAGACVDPTDASSVWIATCYATGTKENNWGIYVGKVCPTC